MQGGREPASAPLLGFPPSRIPDWKVNDLGALGVHGSMAEAAELAARVDPRPARTFEEFFEAEHARLFRAVYLLVGDSYEADEVVQEAFLKLWERWDRVNSLADPRG